jgi:OOP family OmpA-OmpF porin
VLLTGAAHADEGVKLEIGAMGGVHLFAKDLELGVADDPTLTSPKNAGLFGLRLGLVLHPMFTAEVEGVGLPTSDRVNDYRAFIIGWRTHLVFNLPLAEGKVTPFVLAGVGALSVVSTAGTDYNEIKKDTDFVFHFGAGAKFALTRVMHLRLDARLLEVPNTKKNGVSADWEFMGGIGFAFGGSEPAPTPVVVVAPVAGDRDKDGILDASDKCPDKFGTRENGGCPDKDRDMDGTIDRNDKCPDEAGPPARQGCPVGDKDKDGIPDETDKCPTEAEDKDGFEDEDGCPDPDNDKDGIVDEKDKCPNEPETRNGFQDEDGCPDEVPVAVQKFTGVIKGITFRRNSADIKASSFPFLKEAVKVFKDFPTLRIEISGHTSNEGRREFNVKLSRKRAESVKAFLVSAGIEENRVLTVGYGPDKPIEDNGTKAGQEKNRRIEFRLLRAEESEAVSVPEHLDTPVKAKAAGKTKKAKKVMAPDGDPDPSAATPAKPKAKGKAKAKPAEPTP